MSGNVVANGVNYGGPAGQLSALSWTFPSRTAGYTDQYNETRQYNARGQMTRLQYTGVYSLAGTPPSVDQTYTYSSTANDGRLWQMSDAISGEVVQYQYDLLGRLTLAQTTGPQWGESFSYDGFGNLTSEVATKGTAFTSYQTFDPTTNRLVGGGTSYDANGNLLTMAGGLTMSYDEENRMAQAVNSSNATETDIYNPSGQLVYRLGGSVGGNPPAEVYIYGPQGQRLRFGLTLPSWSDNNKVIFTYEEQELYFAGKLLEADDRIGTSAVTPPTYYDGYLVGITTSGTFPYGELRQAPILGDRYATYLLDTTTNLNYARHRWYSSQVARFTTADSYMGSARRRKPQTWNRYAYVIGDPINFNDPTGLVIWGRVGNGVLKGGVCVLGGAALLSAEFGSSGLASAAAALGAIALAGTCTGAVSNLIVGVTQSQDTPQTTQALETAETLMNPGGLLGFTGAAISGANNPMRVANVTATAYTVVSAAGNLPSSSLGSLENANRLAGILDAASGLGSLLSSDEPQQPTEQVYTPPTNVSAVPDPVPYYYATVPAFLEEFGRGPDVSNSAAVDAED